jgi:hypothetical protein
MKLLESTRFEAINNALSITTGDSKIIGRLVQYASIFMSSGILLTFRLIFTFITG